MLMRVPKQINNIFSLGVNFNGHTSKYEVNKYKQMQEAKERFKKWHHEIILMLCDYLHSLNKIEKMQKQEIIEYYIDLLIFGTEEDWLWFKKQKKGGVEKLNENLEQEILKENPPYKVEELNVETILEDKIFDYLLEIPNSPDKTRIEHAI